ncbi:MAG TPA: helix-turn-helix domain-containing protein [Candidatus Baltobacteraceae bacterium]|nr:helix-turn-helix domain-containing protein [Candidatus Baltobacteraceae bacterium]
MAKAKPQLPPPQDDTLLTVADVARRYRTGREQVHRWIRRGQLSGVIRIGKLVRIPQTSLAEFEARHTSAQSR